MVILLVEHCCCIFNNMEKITLNYLMKNMPIPDKTTYYIKMIEKNESLIKHIKWKAHFFLYKKEPHMDKKEAFGFKICYPPGIPKLELLEKGLCNLVNLLKFRANMNSFKGN